MHDVDGWVMLAAAVAMIISLVVIMATMDSKDDGYPGTWNG